MKSVVARVRLRVNVEVVLFSLGLAAWLVDALQPQFLLPPRFLFSLEEERV